MISASFTVRSSSSAGQGWHRPCMSLQESPTTGISRNRAQKPEHRSHRGSPCDYWRGASTLKEFFQRIRLKKGYKIAIVALARKLLAIIHHLLTHQEFFDAEENPKKKRRLPAAPPQAQQYTTQQMVENLVEAGTWLRNRNKPNRTTGN